MYATRFTVVGTGPFPMDMLRYDCCYPARSQDAMEIGLSLARGSDAVRTLDRHVGGTPYAVTLVRTTRTKPTGGKGGVTLDRWKSFGWDLSTVEHSVKVS